MNTFVTLYLIYYWRVILCLRSGDANVCPRYITVSNNTTQRQLVYECCPDYYLNEDKRCTECQPGFYGANCEEKCLPMYYGIQCKHRCNCSVGTICDPEYGCTHSKQTCPEGFYGVDCRKHCVCINNDGCDRKSGQCICRPGWFGEHCIKECPNGTFGKDCKQTCNCPANAKCDIATGECICLVGYAAPQCTKDMMNERVDDPKEIDISGYVIMTASLLLLVCIVAGVVRVKQLICKGLKVCRRNQSAKMKAASVSVTTVQIHEKDVSNTTVIGADLDVSCDPFNTEEAIYCEIEDIM